MGVGSVEFDKDVAAQEGIESSAEFARFSWRIQEDFWVVGIGVSALIYDDNERLSVTVDGDTNFAGYYSSSAYASSFWLESGYSLLFHDYIALDFVGGYELMVDSRRRVRNCRDCLSEDIELDGGFYVGPRLVLLNDHGLSVAASYQYFANGDFLRSASLSLGWRF